MWCDDVQSNEIGLDHVAVAAAANYLFYCAMRLRYNTTHLAIIKTMFDLDRLFVGWREWVDRGGDGVTGERHGLWFYGWLKIERGILFLFNSHEDSHPTIKGFQALGFFINSIQRISASQFKAISPIIKSDTIKRLNIWLNRAISIRTVQSGKEPPASSHRPFQIEIHCRFIRRKHKINMCLTGLV